MFSLFLYPFLKAMKEGDLLGNLFKNHVKWPVLSYIVMESAARFKEDHVGRLLDPQSAINFFLSQGTVT